MNSLAEEYIKEFPKENLDEFFANKNFKEWIVESHEIAKDFIYAEIEYNSRPTDDYMKKSYEIIKRRIALAGYRLAEIIKSIKKSYDLQMKKSQEKKSNEKIWKFLNLAE